MSLMTQLLEQISEWGPVEWVLQYEAVLWWIAIVSGALGVVTLVAAPWLVCVIPDDYFAKKDRPKLRGRSRHPALRWTLRILKNVAGVVLVILGPILMPLPGQGMLVTLAGVLLLDFPGKRRLEMWVIRRPGLLKAINWMRCRRGREPLKVWSPDSPVPVTTKTDCGPGIREKARVLR